MPSQFVQILKIAFILVFQKALDACKEKQRAPTAQADAWKLPVSEIHKLLLQDLATK
jgi:hypothetical protein